MDTGWTGNLGWPSVPSFQRRMGRRGFAIGPRAPQPVFGGLVYFSRRAVSGAEGATGMSLRCGFILLRQDSMSVLRQEEEQRASLFLFFCLF